MSFEAVIGDIERAIQRDVGRGMEAVFVAARGGLWRAASALAASPAPNIGLVTGFFVPGGEPAAAETDGPAGTALLARAFLGAGLTCRLATDTGCERACRAALDAAGAAAVPIDTAVPGAAIDGLIDLWRQSGIDWVIAIERCGPAADGCPRNMRGVDMSAYTAKLDRLFSAGPWRSIAIGDGGNEIGMGNILQPLITRHVPLGNRIACIVPADFLIAAGVSHWGAYALLAALAVLRADWSDPMSASLDPALDQCVLEATVRDGPAVDGVTLRREPTIDAIEPEAHHAVLEAVSALVRGTAA